MASRTTLALAALLLASLGFNVHQRVTRPAPPPPQKQAEPCPEAPPPGASLCEKKLESCEKRGWELALKVMASERPKRDASAPVPAAATTPAKPGDSSRAAQASALCSRAQATLRETWQRDRDAIGLGLAASVADPALLDKSIGEGLDAMRQTLKLGAREAEDLERAYREKRVARASEVQKALEQEPKQWGKMVDAARGLYADEDALVARYAGSEGRDTWRAKQLESRTVLLALFASLADQEWDDSIRW
jgi:hypothetical protein